MLPARHNPFRTERILQVRYRLSGITWEDLLRRLEELNWRAAIVGPEGSGKTTLLEDLVAHLKSQGYTVTLLRLSAQKPRFDPALPPGAGAELSRQDFILLDGAEQLNWLAWRRFLGRCRSAGGLVVTLHRPARLPTLIECRTSPELLEKIVAGIIGPMPSGLREELPALFDRHQGNVRNALSELYDRWSGNL